MDRIEYIKQRMEIDEAAKALALDLIREHFPDVEWKENGLFKLWQNGTLARLTPECDENAPVAGGLYEVNFLTGTVLYMGPDFSKMASAALENPTAYTVEQRGETVVFTIWRGSEAAIMRFEAEALTGNITFRPIQHGEDGEYITMGRKRIYLEESDA